MTHGGVEGPKVNFFSILFSCMNFFLNYIFLKFNSCSLWNKNKNEKLANRKFLNWPQTLVIFKHFLKKKTTSVMNHSIEIGPKVKKIAFWKAYDLFFKINSSIGPIGVKKKSIFSFLHIPILGYTFELLFTNGVMSDREAVIFFGFSIVELTILRWHFFDLSLILRNFLL